MLAPSRHPGTVGIFFSKPEEAIRPDHNLLGIHRSPGIPKLLGISSFNIISMICHRAGSLTAYFG